ncbi:MAG: IS1595 family transposase [Phycisphaeraceae bacterium]|nr:IS1595 family transposase [Phycisphaeraceae bacterium]
MAKKKPVKVGENKSSTTREIPLACADELAAVEFMEKRRWGDCPACPHCGSSAFYKMTDRATGERNARFLWRCRDCKKQYTVRIGTIFEDSRIPLRHWCFAFWAACASKKGVSAKQIQRQTGLSYKSALFMMHRIRFTMADGPNPGKLGGTVEVDETYMGGKPRYRGPNTPRGGATPRPIVMAIVQRGGAVRPKVIPTITADNLLPEIMRHVDPTARVITDENRCYTDVRMVVSGGHEHVKHSAREYVRKGTDIHTNTVEGFFGNLKRGIYGTFHAVSRKHLQAYLDEFAFRYSTRALEDG